MMSQAEPFPVSQSRADNSRAGRIGARLFHILGHLDELSQDPRPMIFSRSGLSVFGGLACFCLAGGDRRL